MSDSSRTESNPSDFDRDIQALIEGELSEEKFNELQESLKKDPALLNQYLAAVRTDHLLRGKHEAEVGDKVVSFPESAAKPAKSSRWIGAGIGIAAAVAVLLLVLSGPEDSVPVEKTELVGETMPEFEFTPGAVFEATRNHSDTLDGRIHEGELVAIREGFVSIVLPSGTEAVIQSPSSFSITGDNRLKLDAGRGWFRVPEGAEGFTVDLPWLEVVDLGTVFTVSADETANRVEVEEGLVEVRDRDSNEVVSIDEGTSLDRYNEGGFNLKTVTSYYEPGTLAATDPVFYEDLTYVPDQDFSRRVPLTGSWEVETGSPRITGGKFVAGENGEDDRTLVYGRFAEAMERGSNDVLLVSFRAKSPENFFHSKGFAGISLFEGEREVTFFGDMSNDSYSWGVVDYGTKYTPESRGQPMYQLPIQGSDEKFTLRYRAKTGDFEIFRGWGVQGVPVLKFKSEKGLGFDRIRVASGKGGDFSFDKMKVTIIR